MALQRRSPGAVVRRRWTAYTLAGDVVAALAVGIAISGTIGWIIFFLGLVIAGFVYASVTQVMRNRY